MDTEKTMSGRVAESGQRQRGIIDEVCLNEIDSRSGSSQWKKQSYKALKFVHFPGDGDRDLRRPRPLRSTGRRYLAKIENLDQLMRKVALSLFDIMIEAACNFLAKPDNIKLNKE